MKTRSRYNVICNVLFQVGVPAKSAVSGAIIIIIPNVCGIACFSPPLDKCGNSVRGVEFCTVSHAEVLDFSHYSPLPPA